MSEELKSCPFCGQQPLYEMVEGVWKEHHIITCQNIAERCVGCSCKPMWYASKIKAIEAWNTRAAEAELATLRGQLKEAETRHVQFMVEGGPVVMATDYDTLREENARLKALAEWTPIDEQHLPTMGDEVGCFDGAQCCVYEATANHTLFTATKWHSERAMTHFRPVNAPPAGKEENNG